MNIFYTNKEELLGKKLKAFLLSVFIFFAASFSSGNTLGAWQGTIQIAGNTVSTGAWGDSQIIEPLLNEVVSGTTDLLAYYLDENGDGNDGVQWAVRAGTCNAGTNTRFGNVDGFNTPFTWDGIHFGANIDTTTVADGVYCFIFNPTEDAGSVNQRLTRNFVIQNTVVPLAPLAPSVPQVGDIVLNEVLAKPISTSTPPADREFIELFNNSVATVDLAGWKVSELSGATETFRTIVDEAECVVSPATKMFIYGGGTTINPSDFAVLQFCSNTTHLNDGGDTVNLYDTTDSLFDTYTYTTSVAGKSDARVPDGTGAWVDPVPTPGQSNKVMVEDLLNEGWSDSEIEAVKEDVLDYATFSADIFEANDVVEADDVATSSVKTTDDKGGSGGGTSSKFVFNTGTSSALENSQANTTDTDSTSTSPEVEGEEIATTSVELLDEDSTESEDQSIEEVEEDNSTSEVFEAVVEVDEVVGEAEDQIEEEVVDGGVVEAVEDLSPAPETASEVAIE